MVICHRVESTFLSWESVLFLVPYIYVMWVITRMQVMLSSICSLISSCGVADGCSEITMCVGIVHLWTTGHRVLVCCICHVLCGDITSSHYWILRLFLFHGMVLLALWCSIWIQQSTHRNFGIPFPTKKGNSICYNIQPKEKYCK
jgi:hypothetical protein